MEEINELIENLILDVMAEGIGSVAGIGLLTSLFWGGGFVAFQEILCFLVSVI